MSNPKRLIESDVISILEAQNSLEHMQAELMVNETFRAFLEAQKRFTEQSAAMWQRVESAMIANGIKSVRGEWGAITIAQRLSFAIDETKLPRKFKKIVPDTKKIADTFRLEGEAPPGTEPKYTKYLTKRLK